MVGVTNFISMIVRDVVIQRKLCQCKSGKNPIEDKWKKSAPFGFLSNKQDNIVLLERK